MNEPPSHRPEYRRAYRKAYLRDNLEKVRLQKRISYHRNRESITRRQRNRYATDTEYHNKMLSRARQFKREFGIYVKSKRKEQYWKNPDKAKTDAARWRNNNFEQALQRAEKYREQNRIRLREYAANEAFNLTDSYVRNQLSKYSDHPTSHWTQVQVNAKRRMILMRRARKMTKENCQLIRSQYGPGMLGTLARRFGVSNSLIWLIVKNKVHITKHEQEALKLESVKKAFQLLNAAKQMTT